MSPRQGASEAPVRVVEFDLLEDELVTPRATSTDNDWLGRPEPARPRVLRGAVAGVGAYELPGIDTLHEPVVRLEHPLPDPDADRRGAAAIAWAVGYRDGFDRGRGEGLAQGHADGLANGTARGREEALRTGRASAQAAIDALETEARETLALLRSTTEEVAANATRLALQIAELVLEREIMVSDDPGAEAVRRAARLLPDTGAAEPEALVARLHPDDVARMLVDPAGLVSGRSLQVLPDSNVPPGSCALEAGATRVDASIPAALDRIALALGLEAGR